MTTTPILAIPLVGPTQNDKTTTMNDAIAAIEDATQDQLAVSFASGNVTLTALQYTRHLVFICSGLTADRNLVVPLTKRLFVVRNSSAYNVTVKGATGATVVIAAGDGAIIHCDATDCVSLAAGGAGPTGPTGLPGGAITIGYTFDTTTTNSDPGSGTLRLNAGTQNTATAIYLDLLDSNGADWTATLDSLDDSTSTVKGHIRLFDRTDDSKFLLFTISAVTSHTGYRELTVAIVESSTASPFSAADSLALAFSRTGNTGSTGATGSTGSTGAAGATWHDGAGAPSDGLGANGDYYLDDTSLDVYHKNTSNSPQWAVVANIHGTTGADGNRWYDGSGAPSDGLGANADYYLDDATGNVYLKNTSNSPQWSVIANIIGPTGATGATGSAGSTGSTGAAGAAGSKWYDGSGVPSGGLGADGDYYLDDSNGDIYTKVTSNSPQWGVVFNVASAALSTAAFAALDLSTLPTSDPGGGKAWLNGGVLQVGA